jgi:hypothetical protein
MRLVCAGCGKTLTRAGRYLVPLGQPYARRCGATESGAHGPKERKKVRR